MSNPNNAELTDAPAAALSATLQGETVALIKVDNNNYTYTIPTGTSTGSALVVNAVTEATTNYEAGSAEPVTVTVTDCNHDGMSEEWLYNEDGDYHWHYCELCRSVLDKAEHTGGTATCIGKAVCEVCQQPYGAVAEDNHAGETGIRNAEEATCEEEGYTGDEYCKACDKTTKAGTVIEKKKHTGGTATCKEQATCSSCGQLYGSKDATNHVGGTEIRDKVTAEIGKEGYTGDTYCLGCGTKLATGETIPALTPAPTPEVTPSVPTPKPTPEVTPSAPTVTPRPTAVPTATPVPTSAPQATAIPTPTPVAGLITVPELEEPVVNEKGEEVSALVQTPGSETKLVIPGVTDVENGTGSDAKEAVIWTSSNGNVATVSEDGTVTMKEPGMAEITVTVGEGKEAKAETIVVVVTEQPFYNNPADGSEVILLGTSKADTDAVRFLMTGEKLDINFYGVKNWKRDKFECVWESSDTDVLTTNSTGIVTAKGVGVATLTLTITNKETGKQLVTAPVLFVVPASMENRIMLGTSSKCTFEELTLAQNERVDLNFYGVKGWKKEAYDYTWLSSDETVVWVDKFGKLTPVHPGKATVALILVEKKTGAPLYVMPVEVTVEK